MSYWKLAFRLRSPCSGRLDIISYRPVSFSVRNLSLNRNYSTSLQSPSNTTEEPNSSTTNDEELKYRTTNYHSSVSSATSTSEESEADLEIDKDAKIKAKIVFNTHLYNVDPEQNWLRKKILETKAAKQNVREIRDYGYAPMKSAALKYLDGYIGPKRDIEQPKDIAQKEEKVHASDIEIVDLAEEEEDVHFPFADDHIPDNENPPIRKEYLPRKLRIEKLAALNSDRILREKIKNVMDQRWMSDYEYFREGTLEQWQKMYGTPQKKIPVSKIPCGGCGAHFQCQEPAIPGYLPSEIFLELSPHEFKSIVCQRCHFLKNYEIALDVQVPPAEYPAVLDEIARRKGLVILIIDLLDFPCSIWPGITNIIGKSPVIVVGNKVDLLPGDHEGYLNHVKQVLQNSLEKHGLGTIQLKNIRLVSARSGFGVEELITELQRMSEYKGDVFLLGCTNVGKSTLFNCLLQSDMCKVQAVDLVQRATTSQWPNTTLNLLKFPMMRPAGWRLEQRVKRLNEKKNTAYMEKRLRAIQFNRNHIYHMPSFMEFVGRTFLPSRDSEKNQKDVFNTKIYPHNKKKLGLDENDAAFRHGRWCYDTPGVSHPDQILTLLTTEELLEVLPSSSLVPRTFRFQLGQSLFVGGLARLDFIDGEENYIWVTVFASEKLPVTIVWTKDAEEVYNYSLGTEVLQVPHSGENRLARWPGLKSAPRPYKLFSEVTDKSGADLVLSSTGWISVTTDPLKKVTLLPWTPEARGIYFRIPALIPYAIRFRGARVPRTPMYDTKRAGSRYDSEVLEEAQGEK